LHLTFAKKSNPSWAKTFDPEKFLDQKIAKQNKARKPKVVKVNPLQALAKAGVKIGTIWSWSRK